MHADIHMTAYEEVNKKVIEEEHAKQCTGRTRAPKETDQLLNTYYPPPSYFSNVRTATMIQNYD